MRVLVDTNILIYAHDPSDPGRRAKALQIVEDLATARQMVVSTQVLNEFYSRITRASRPPALSHPAAAAILRNIARSALVLPMTDDVCLRALDGVELHGLSWWDALIWAVAKQNGVLTVYTEDMPSATVIEGVQYVDPLATTA